MPQLVQAYTTNYDYDYRPINYHPPLLLPLTRTTLIATIPISFLLALLITTTTATFNVTNINYTHMTSSAISQCVTLETAHNNDYYHPLLTSNPGIPLNTLRSTFALLSDSSAQITYLEATSPTTAATTINATATTACCDLLTTTHQVK